MKKDICERLAMCAAFMLIVCAPYVVAVPVLLVSCYLAAKKYF